MLPAIVFVFSRDRCDSAAKEVYNDGKSLLSEEEMNFVREKLEAYELANPQVKMKLFFMKLTVTNMFKAEMLLFKPN